MTTLDTLRQFFDYDAKANRRTAESLQGLDTAESRAVRVFGHILMVEKLWLARLLHSVNAQKPADLWARLSYDEMTRIIDELEKEWADYLASVADNDGLETIVVAYVTTEGKQQESKVVDILHHVVMHSVYHRGQIASFVKTEGGTPAKTDYLLFFLEPQ